MKRINSIINDSEFLNSLGKNKEAEINRIYCHHDISHFLDVSRISYIISLEENLNIDKEVLYAIGLLHDIGRWMEYESGVDHAAASIDIAERILLRAQFKESEIKDMLHAIKCHRKKDNLTVLGHILYQADKLSRNCIMCDAIMTCKNFQNDEKPYIMY